MRRADAAAMTTTRASTTRASITPQSTARDLWALGDYDRIAALVSDLGTQLVSAAEVGPGMRVLDVGAGTGNAALAAAASGADVVATDVTSELLAVGERHARERGLTLRWQVADAQALPFDDDALEPE
jgi:ubiquinone/menaquinone biosynthesis C-methylase UbiE